MLKENKPFDLGEKFKWWESLNEEQKIYIYVGVASLMAAIRSNRPMKQATVAIRLIRHRFPNKPGGGANIRKSRQKLAANFWMNGE